MKRGVVVLEMVIPRLPVSPNALRGRHWTVKHKDRNDWAGQVMVAAANQKALPHGDAEKVRRIVSIALFSPYRPMDPDNLHGAVKPILDALKGLRLIYDDSKEWLEYAVSEAKCGTLKEQRTEITVRALEA